jgi:predicted dehydrogenase
MEGLRIGIIGIGNMGSIHALNLFKNEISGATLTALCDIIPERLQWAKETFGDAIQLFDDMESFFASSSFDGIIIATAHYDHPRIAIRAFELGIHVLCEKPAGVYTKQVRLMNEAAKASGKVFGIMYNQRTNPLYLKLKDMIAAGELGEIRRTNWIITNWYRPQSYYDSGGWRATWSGEGGGVLINQDPHQLDLWQWTTSMMPKRVRAACYFGKYRHIEVEDDVTAFVEYENGATGVFVTTTGEAPGTNRYEISGDHGKIVIEDGKLTFWRLHVSEPEFNRDFKGKFGQPDCTVYEIPIEGKESGHNGIIENWVQAIIHGTPLLAPGEEGIHGLMISNAMLLSAWTDGWVNMPIDEEQFYEQLQARIAESQARN